MGRKMRVAVVTGASRGIGRGIATVLAKEGLIVYATARSMGSLKELAENARRHGGIIIPHECDHSNDTSTEDLFLRVAKEQKRLDLLVNNAYTGVSAVFDHIGKPFWEKPLSQWDASHTVGLRSHYICSVFAARQMVPQGSGLIVNISSGGGLQYLFDVAYGAGKCALDRMSADMGKELKPHGVAVISLWPGEVKTEATEEKNLFPNGESVFFSGHAIAALLKEPDLMRRTGKVVMTTELAIEHGFTDIDGQIPGKELLATLRRGLGRPPFQWRPAVPASKL